MDEHTRIANALKEASANIHEIQNKGCETDLEINEQLANEMLELERILGWDVTRPEGFAFERLAQLIDPTCTLIYRDTTPRGADECDMDWEWRCSNCNVNLSERYDDLDINTFEELGLTYCPNCGKKVTFGSCYTSKEIHTPHGFGYAVCENCYNIERAIENRWRNK